MATERIFNIFIYFVNGKATEYGVRYHRAPGDDATKIAFLKDRVDQDHPVARRFSFSRSFTPEEWLSVFRLGSELGYFEEAFRLLRAPRVPVFGITSIVDGVPKIDLQIGPGPFRGEIVTKREGRGSVDDYLVHYIEGDTFRFTELIHDDYFKAIKALFNAKLYVSCAKLLMSCVDTLAFVEYGDVNGNFTRWLEHFADLTPHRVTADEVWEFRNSVLHMTNLASRKVISGKVSPIMPYVGGPSWMPSEGAGHPKLFNLTGMINTIADGISNWGTSYNDTPEKIQTFVERYDTTISDSRMAWFPYQGENDSAL